MNFSVFQTFKTFAQKFPNVSIDLGGTPDCEEGPNFYIGMSVAQFANQENDGACRVHPEINVDRTFQRDVILVTQECEDDDIRVLRVGLTLDDLELELDMYIIKNERLFGCLMPDFEEETLNAIRLVALRLKSIKKHWEQLLRKAGWKMSTHIRVWDLDERDAQVHVSSSDTREVTLNIKHDPWCTRLYLNWVDWWQCIVAVTEGKQTVLRMNWLNYEIPPAKKVCKLMNTLFGDAIMSRIIPDGWGTSVLKKWEDASDADPSAP